MPLRPLGSSLPVLLLVVASLALTVIDARAQQRGQRPGGAAGGTVGGVVVDAGSEEPILSATVALWSARDSSLVTGAVTQDDGSFTVENLRPGQYYARFSFVGYDAKTVSDIAITREQRSVDLGRVALAENATELDEVEVEAEREFQETAIDRTIYNTKDQPVTVGGTATDVLETIPSVEVDIDGNISLRGNENVVIYLNGKPAPMSGEALTSFLRGLSSDGIERVEVIPNPSARYEPEGMSGIINIVLAKNQDIGFGGGIQATASTNEDYGASLNVNYGQGPWSLYANYGVRSGLRQSGGDRFQENIALTGLPYAFLEQESDSEQGRLSHNLNTTLERQLGERNTLSLSALLSQRSGDADESTLYEQFDAEQDMLSAYIRSTQGDRNDFNMDYRLGFRRVVEPSTHELTAELSYEYEREGSDERYLESPRDGSNTTVGALQEQQRIDQDEQGHEASAELDYKRPLGENFSLEAGYQGEFERLDNTFYSESLQEDAFRPDDDLNNAFIYDQMTHAGYGILGAQVGPFGLQAGVRLEQALTTFDLETNNESFDNDYFSLYPSVHTSYNPLERLTLKASYSKRVNRPNTWQLNPFGDFDDPTFRRQGNPYLLPEYTHSFEVGGTQLGDAYTLSFSPYFRRTVDAISWNERVIEENGQSVTLLTFDNFATEDSYGAELTASLRLGQWLNTNFSFNAYKRVTDGSNVRNDLSSSGYGYSTRGMAMIRVQPTLSLQLMQFYRSPIDVPGGRISSFTMTNIALRQELWNGRASLGLSAHDVFDTMGFSSERETDQYYQLFTRDFGRRGVQVSLRYNFGQQDRERRRDEGGREGGGGEEGFEGMGMGG